MHSRPLNSPRGGCPAGAGRGERLAWARGDSLGEFSHLDLRAPGLRAPPPGDLAPRRRLTLKKGIGASRGGLGRREHKGAARPALAEVSAPAPHHGISGRCVGRSVRRWPEVARWLSWGAKRPLGAEADVAHPLPGWRDGCDPAAAPQTALSPERSGHRGAGRSALEEARGSAGPRRERHPAPSTFWMGTPRQGLGAAAAILMKPVYRVNPRGGWGPTPFPWEPG